MDEQERWRLSFFSSYWFQAFRCPEALGGWCSSAGLRSEVQTPSTPPWLVLVGSGALGSLDSCSSRLVLMDEQLHQPVKSLFMLQIKQHLILQIHNFPTRFTGNLILG